MKLTKPYSFVKKNTDINVGGTINLKDPLKIQLFFLGILFSILSCDDIIFEEDISESFVHILAPVNNAQVRAGNISFNWEPVTYANAYQLQIALPNFANAQQIVLDTIISNTSFSKILLPNNYEWRLRAENSAFETVYFTNLLSITEVNNVVIKGFDPLSGFEISISN